ncbi:TolC family outer membrane protein [Metapseudomonas boanensis]|uniref:TolC family outer membrane protein n=1 Tax=Metapseudomonas boanensis TaxID=2822138 RepID=A0ABS5XDU5_9GAMM|nr:TolC family outer membrane protein [Pseudomonas boanensis]MBT8765443.1 TolC family outer membrane protein [Pseudomonas boanensis]
MTSRMAIAALLGVYTTSVSAMDLTEAWNTFQNQGPTYLASVHEREAGQEYKELGKAGVLPQINSTAFWRRIDGTSEQDTVLGRTVETDLEYDSKGAVVELRQPIFNKQKMAEYRQGKQRTLFSDYVFDTKTQESALSLSSRYFAVLLALETIELAKVRLKAFEQQVAAAKRRFELGDGTVTDVDQATARRDLAQAELIEAEDNLLVARRLLQELLGVVPEEVTTLRTEFPTPPLDPPNLQDWINDARANNPTIQARTLGVQIAEEEVKRASAGHWPTLDFVAAYNDSESDSVSTQNQKNEYGSVGVEFRMPLYLGGSTSAQVRQAAANRERVREELNATREDVLSGTTREFRGVQSGEARVRALELAVVSSERAQDSARKGFQAGTSTNLDILNAEEQAFITRRDLLEAKLRYLLARLRLSASVGALGQDDIEQANNYLGPVIPLRP